MVDYLDRSGAVDVELPEKQGAVGRATRAELEAAHRTTTAMGQAALVLAARLDSGLDNGTALASLAKEWRATLEAATADSSTDQSPLDLLRERRMARQPSGRTP